MTTYAKSKCKVMFAQCNGNSVISSSTVCMEDSHKLNSEGVPTMRSISILQMLVLSDITDVSVLRISQFFLRPRQFPHFTTVSPKLHMFSTTLISPPTVIISDPMESRSRDHAHDYRIAPMAAAVAWYFSPRVVLNVLLERICCFCSVFLTY